MHSSAADSVLSSTRLLHASLTRFWSGPTMPKESVEKKVYGTGRIFSACVSTRLLITPTRNCIACCLGYTSKLLGHAVSSATGHCPHCGTRHVGRAPARSQPTRRLLRACAPHVHRATRRPLWRMVERAEPGGYAPGLPTRAYRAICRLGSKSLIQCHNASTMTRGSVASTAYLTHTVYWGKVH